jgi:outer membrane protein
MRACFLFLYLIIGLSIPTFAAPTAFDDLLERALQKNAEYSAALKEKEAAQMGVNGSHSGFYPTLDAVAGWEDRNEEIDPAKGKVGYLRGQWNLFNGFKDSATNDRAQAELLAKEADLEIKKRDLKLALREAISEMLYLHGLQEILTEEIKVAQTQKQMASKKVAAGLTSSVDDLEFDLRSDELEIQKRRIDQSHIEAHQKLFRIFGEELVDSDIGKINFRGIDEIYQVLKNTKIDNNPTVLKAQANYLASESERMVARSEFIPKLDFEYALGRVSPTEELDAKFNEYRVGLFLTIPLFSGFNSSYKIKSAAAQLGARDKDKTQVSYNIRTEFETIKEKMKEALDLYQINERKRVTAKKYFDMTLGEYRRGIKNSPDLVGATERLFDSEKQKYELQKDLEILSTKLENLI